MSGTNIIVTIVGIRMFRPANLFYEPMFNLVTSDGDIVEPWMGDDTNPNYVKTGVHTKANMERFIGRTFELVNNSTIYGEYWPDKMVEVVDKPRQAGLFDTPEFSAT